ncbi:putative glycosyltransferase EpsH [Lachnospiraceae bacterium]|nr:putative glycosyltransferase EpsH [Lachnospiraceae bacterium]
MEKEDKDNNLAKLVTVIVPVYNSEKYMDQCLESISSQTYRNLEIILVYDISDDSTLQKCKRWQKRDKRIRIIMNERRKGLGAARNQGLNNALGEYIIYVDSDDWIEKNYIKILYEEIEKEHADYVSSNSIYRVSEASGDTELCISGMAGIYNTEELRHILLLQDFPSIWKKIINKKWLLEQKLYQPEIFAYEDWGYAPVFILHASKVILLQEPGCYYRVNAGCLSNTLSQKKIWQDFINTCMYFINRFRTDKCFDKNIELLRRYTLEQFYYRKIISDCEDESVKEKIEEFHNEILIRQMKFDVRLNMKNAIIFGSFSARWEVQASYLFTERIRHYCFSSLIAAMTRPKECPGAVQHSNVFRKCQIEQDLLGRFERDLMKIREVSYLFIDFLEERHGIIELKDRNYVTDSEAFIESGIEAEGRKIDFYSEEFWMLWKEKCNAFIRLIREMPNIRQVILIKNRLSLKSGDFRVTKDYAVAGLSESNYIIEKMENYFLENCDLAQSIEIPSYMQFTDKMFRYGCEPQYMNQAAYLAAGVGIFKRCRTII